MEAMEAQRGLDTKTNDERPRPGPDCRGRLGDEGYRILMQTLRHRHDYIHHPALDEDGTEENLFGPDFEPILAANTKCGGLHTIPQRYVRMTPDQERMAFLRYNYARRSVIRLLACCSEGTDLDVRTAEELVRWYRRVLAVRTYIVNTNFPLVLAMSRHSRFTQLDTNEMISEGNLALLRSINKFDLTKGYRFSSYACRSILKAFARVAMRVSRYRQHFPAEFEPSVDRTESVDPREGEVNQNFVEELKTILVKNAAHLNKTERLVIMQRFALDSVGHVQDSQTTEPKTLGEVGEMIGLTKERVRQIQNRALEKLRIAMTNRFAAA